MQPKLSQVAFRSWTCSKTHAAAGNYCCGDNLLYCSKWSVQCSLKKVEVSGCSLLVLTLSRSSEWLGVPYASWFSTCGSDGGKGLRCACTVSSGHQQKRASLCLHLRHQHKTTWRTAEPDLWQAINTVSADSHRPSGTSEKVISPRGSRCVWLGSREIE